MYPEKIMVRIKKTFIRIVTIYCLFNPAAHATLPIGPNPDGALIQPICAPLALLGHTPCKTNDITFNKNWARLTLATAKNFAEIAAAALAIKKLQTLTYDVARSSKTSDIEGALKSNLDKIAAELKKKLENETLFPLTDLDPVDNLGLARINRQDHANEIELEVNTKKIDNINESGKTNMPVVYGAIATKACADNDSGRYCENQLKNISSDVQRSDYLNDLRTESKVKYALVMGIAATVNSAGRAATLQKELQILNYRDSLIAHQIHSENDVSASRHSLNSSVIDDIKQEKVRAGSASPFNLNNVGMALLKVGFGTAITQLPTLWPSLTPR